MSRIQKFCGIQPSNRKTSKIHQNAKPKIKKKKKIKPKVFAETYYVKNPSDYDDEDMDTPDSFLHNERYDPHGKYEIIAIIAERLNNNFFMKQYRVKFLDEEIEDMWVPISKLTGDGLDLMIYNFHVMKTKLKNMTNKSEA